MSTVNELRHPDIVFLPGSKNTMGDLLWMRQNGLEAAVKKLSCEIPVFGICGGYQMLGASIADPDGVEEGGYMRSYPYVSHSPEMCMARISMAFLILQRPPE